jgi:predicted RNA-binding Zn-ribbon protein involved in translation (DUF1610 family)
MSAVMIRCPVTGQAVSTQIETEPSVFETLPQVEAHTLCPVCGQEHIWTRRDAWLQESKQGRVERLPPTLLP